MVHYTAQYLLLEKPLYELRVVHALSRLKVR
jgi:hypothetical protein